MPKIQLASQRLQRAQQGGISPQLVSSRSAGQIQAAQIGTPQVAAGAGQVQYTPFPVPNIQKDTLSTVLESGAGFADTLVQSAFKYQQRQDQAIADFQVLEADKELRTLLYGELKEDGTLAGGYLNTAKLTASQGYGGFQGGVKDRLQKRIENLTPQQRQFAMSRLHQLENAYLTKGATHASSELAAAEKDLIDQGYTAAMETMQTNIILGHTPDLNLMASALAKYTDADDRKKRDADMTSVALTQSLLKQGPKAAFALAQQMAMTVGVGDPVTINNFIKDVQANARAEKGHEMSLENFRRSTVEYHKGQATDAANNFLVDNLAHGLTQNRAGEVLAAAAGMYSDSTTAQTHMERILVDSVKQGWENSKPAGPGGTAAYAETVRGQLDQIDPRLRDDVARELVALEREQEEQIRKGMANQAELVDRIRKQSEQAVTVQTDKILTDLYYKQADLNSPSTIEAIGDLLEHPHISDADRERLNTALNDGNFPEEPAALFSITENWEDYVNNPSKLDGERISLPNKIMFKERIQTDRKTGAAPYRAAAVHRLQSYFKLRSQDGALVLMGNNDPKSLEGLNEEQVKAHYNDALSLFQSILDGELRLDKDQTPGQAVLRAEEMILSNKVLRGQMVGLPGSELGEGKVKDLERPIPVTYLDKHDKVVAMFRLPEGVIPGLQGSANVLTWVNTLGKEQQENGEQIDDPKLVAYGRINEVYRRLVEMKDNARTPAEADAVAALIKNHTAQAEHLETLTPASWAGGTGNEQVTNVTDADTIKIKDKGRVRNPNLGAAEIDTPEGILQQAKVEQAMMALSPDGRFKFEYAPGTGAFNRRLGDAFIGDANMDVIAREELGIPEYKGNK